MKSFTGPGSTPSRRRFWDQVTDSVNASRKIAGRFVTVDEYPGKGSVINVPDSNRGRGGGGGGATCPTPVTIQFSELTFDCGCTFFTQDLSTTFEIEDEGNANGFVTTLNLGIHAFPACGDCPDGDGNDQFWEPPSVSSDFLPHISVSVWENADCSGDPEPPQEELIFPVLILLSGVYYLFAFIQSTSTLVFYATASSISGPFNNTLSCNTNFVTFSDPAVVCRNNGSPQDFNVIAHGGTATVGV